MANRITQQMLTVWYITNNAKARITQQSLTSLWFPQVTNECLNDAALLTPPSAYPVPLLGGPQYSHFMRLANTYSTLSAKFATGGSDYRARNEHFVARWRFEYRFLSLDDAAILDAHFTAARGSFFGFEFTDPRTSLRYTNVRYAPGGYKFLEHEKRYFPIREVELMWTSAGGRIVGSGTSDTWDSSQWDASLFGS